jgi:translation initiation factor IF-2
MPANILRRRPKNRNRLSLRSAAPAKTEERNDVLPGVKVIGKIDLNNLNAKPQPVAEKPAPVE